MTKTFKTCVIFCISAVWLALMRIVFSYVNLGDYLTDWLFSFSVQIIGMGVIPFVLYKFWVREDLVEGFYLRAKINPLIYLISIVLGLLMSLLLVATSAVWQALLSLIGFTRTTSVGTVYPTKDAVGVFILELVTTALLPGIFEELNYRGLGMRMLSNVKDEKVVIIMIGVLFGLGHQFIMQTVYAFVAGLILGYIAVKTKSILPGMIIHFLNNAISVCGEYSEQKGGVFAEIQNSVYNFIFSNWLYIILAIVIDAVLIVFLLKLIKVLSARNQEEEDEDGYYYPNKTQYIDDLFGMMPVIPKRARKEKTRWYDYAGLYAGIAIMLSVTVFTFVWGMWR